MQKRRQLTSTEREEADRLRRAWEAYKAVNKGATQAWLGMASGVGTQGAIGQYLRGYIPLNIEALTAICRAIGADPHAISPRLMQPMMDVMPGPNFASRPDYDNMVLLTRHEHEALLARPTAQVELIYASAHEISVLTIYRESTAEGRALIDSAVEAARELATPRHRTGAMDK